MIQITNFRFPFFHTKIFNVTWYKFENSEHTLRRKKKISNRFNLIVLKNGGPCLKLCTTHQSFLVGPFPFFLLLTYFVGKLIGEELLLNFRLEKAFRANHTHFVDIDFGEASQFTQSRSRIQVTSFGFSDLAKPRQKKRIRRISNQIQTILRGVCFLQSKWAKLTGRSAKIREMKFSHPYLHRLRRSSPSNRDVFVVLAVSPSWILIRPNPGNHLDQHRIWKLRNKSELIY